MTYSLPPTPDDEADRLADLRSYRILDTPPEQTFDDLTTLAAAICGTPEANLTLIDAERQWFKSRYGAEGSETERGTSFCAHTLVPRQRLVVPDATADPRFAGNPWVEQDPGVRFYAGSPLLTPRGHVLGTICVVDREPRALTALQLDALDALSRQAMAALEFRRRALELEQLGELVDLAQEAIILRSPDGVIRLWNDGAVQLYGWTAAEAMGRRTHELLDTRFPIDLDTQEQLLTDEGAWNGRLDHRTKSGARVIVDSRQAMHRDPDGVETVMEINFDMTEREQLDALKDEFVSLVSHELRTPLASIRGYVEVLLDEDGGPLTETQRRFLEVVDRNGERLHAIVDDLLLIARVQAGKLELERGTVALEEIAREAVESATPVAAQKEVELSLDVNGGSVVDGDRIRLAQVVDNLVSNALKFTQPGGRITLRVREDARVASLEVEDTGTGISADELEHLFQPFYRTSSSVEDAVPGTGLGLAICKAMVEAHGGRIGVSSLEGRGTTVRVELPR